MSMPKLQRVVPVPVPAPSRESWETLMKKIVLGQDHIIEQIAPTIELFHAGLHTYRQPVGVFLLLGKTGMGKTHFVKSLAEVFHQDEKRLINVNCAEYYSPHECARLIGAPPGYLGHRESVPVLAQQRVRNLESDHSRLKIILLDEFEKAHESLHHTFLSVFDQGRLSLGDGTTTNFEECIFFLTSNLGLSNLAEYRTQFGYVPSEEESFGAMQRSLVEIARRKLSPEFMNRLDEILLFRTLTEEDLLNIIKKQVEEIAIRLGQALSPGFRDDKKFLKTMFQVILSPETLETILREGFDKRYGARPMIRSLKKHVSVPLAKFIQNKEQFQPLLERDSVQTFQVFPEKILWTTG